MAKKEGKAASQGAEYVFRGLFEAESQNQRLLQLCVWLSLTLLVALLALAYLALRPKEPVYFGMNQQMQILPMYPLSEPIYSDGALKSYATQAACALFNLDFLHWRKQLATLRKYFTKRAYVSFGRSLKEEGHLKILSQYRALMHGSPLGAPIIVAAGVVDNRMTWELEMPFQLAYETSEKVLSNQQFLISMRIQRVSTAEYAEGIAISQLVLAKEHSRSPST